MNFAYDTDLFFHLAMKCEFTMDFEKYCEEFLGDQKSVEF
jgi:hypothetical protein